MKDEELFELCKQVYEATGWNDSNLSFFHNTVASTAPPNYEVVENREYHHIEAPLYTSDYLLEKLPMEQFDIYLAPNPGVGWYVSSSNTEYNVPRRDADTPLKALLKLTLALHKEKLL